ncbi:7492_t:CDS:2, partial [Racocetra fulgida]
CTALCKSWEFNTNTISYFTLERRAYNLLTARYVTSEVACSYDAGNSRHIGVQKAIESKAILSVCGELYKGNNMVQILTSEIEWNHTYSTSKVIVNKNSNHLEEQNPTNENENKTQNANDDNTNSKSNILKSAIKKTMKKK